jgi:hypothetical protein
LFCFSFLFEHLIVVMDVHSLGDFGLVCEKESSLAMLQSVAGTAFESSPPFAVVGSLFSIRQRIYEPRDDRTQTV